MYRSDRIIIRYFPRFRNRFFPESDFSSSYRRTFYQVFRIFVKSRNLKNQGFLQNDLIIFQFYRHGIQENFLKFRNVFTNFLTRNNIVLHRENSAGMSEHDGQFFDIDLVMDRQRCVYMTQIVPVKIIREAVKFFQGIEIILIGPAVIGSAIRPVPDRYLACILPFCLRCLRSAAVVAGERPPDVLRRLVLSKIQKRDIRWMSFFVCSSLVVPNGSKVSALPRACRTADMSASFPESRSGCVQTLLSWPH